MDPILIADADSYLLKSLSQEQMSYPFNYSLMKNDPISSRTYNYVIPTSNPVQATDPSGQQLTFKINRYMLLQDIVIRTKLTGTATNNNTVPFGASSELGLRLFSQMRLTSNGKLICSSDAAHAQVRQRASESEKALGISALSEPLSLAGSGPAVILTAVANIFYVYTPFFMSFSEASSMYIDTKFVEDLYLELTYSQASDLGTTSAPSPTTLGGATTDLWVFYRFLEQKTYENLRANNFPEGSSSTFLITDQYAESKLLLPSIVIPTIANGIITAIPSPLAATMDLRCKKVVTSLSFFLTDDQNPTGKLRATNTFSSGAATAPNIQVAIGTFTFVFAGQNVLGTNVPIGVLLYDESVRYGKSALICDNTGVVTRAKTDVGPFTQYFGESSSTIYNSSAVSFYNGGQPQLICNISNIEIANVNATYGTGQWLRALEQFIQFMIVDSSNGHIDIAAST